MANRSLFERALTVLPSWADNILVRVMILQGASKLARLSLCRPCASWPCLYNEVPVGAARLLRWP